MDVRTSRAVYLAPVLVAEIKRTYDALLEVLVEAVVADLLQQQRMKLLERLEVLEMSIDHVQIFTRAICWPASYRAFTFISIFMYTVSQKKRH